VLQERVELTRDDLIALDCVLFGKAGSHIIDKAARDRAARWACWAWPDTGGLHRDDESICVPLVAVFLGLMK
jgi:hypothetical protein